MSDQIIAGCRAHIKRMLGLVWLLGVPAGLAPRCAHCGLALLVGLQCLSFLRWRIPFYVVRVVPLCACATVGARFCGTVVCESDQCVSIAADNGFRFASVHCGDSRATDAYAALASRDSHGDCASARVRVGLDALRTESGTAAHTRGFRKDHAGALLKPAAAPLPYSTAARLSRSIHVLQLSL